MLPSYPNSGEGYVRQREVALNLSLEQHGRRGVRVSEGQNDVGSGHYYPSDQLIASLTIRSIDATVSATVNSLNTPYG